MTLNIIYQIDNYMSMNFMYDKSKGARRAFEVLGPLMREINSRVGQITFFHVPSNETHVFLLKILFDLIKK